MSESAIGMLDRMFGDLHMCGNNKSYETLCGEIENLIGKEALSGFLNLFMRPEIAVTSMFGMYRQLRKHHIMEVLGDILASTEETKRLHIRTYTNELREGVTRADVIQVLKAVANLEDLALNSDSHRVNRLGVIWNPITFKRFIPSKFMEVLDAYKNLKMDPKPPFEFYLRYYGKKMYYIGDPDIRTYAHRVWNTGAWEDVVRSPELMNVVMREIITPELAVSITKMMLVGNYTELMQTLNVRDYALAMKIGVQVVQKVFQHHLISETISRFWTEYTSQPHLEESEVKQIMENITGRQGYVSQSFDVPDISIRQVKITSSVVKVMLKDELCRSALLELLDDVGLEIQSFFPYCMRCVVYKGWIIFQGGVRAKAHNKAMQLYNPEDLQDPLLQLDCKLEHMYEINPEDGTAELYNECMWYLRKGIYYTMRDKLAWHEGAGKVKLISYAEDILDLRDDELYVYACENLLNSGTYAKFMEQFMYASGNKRKKSARMGEFME